MKITDALKVLYKALGGNPDDVKEMTLNPEIILAMADVVMSMGGTLPEVTLEDNGKVLAVVNGAWQATEIKGGKAK
jgi:hypothetical protein